MSQKVFDYFRYWCITYDLTSIVCVLCFRKMNIKDKNYNKNNKLKWVTVFEHKRKKLQEKRKWYSSSLCNFFKMKEKYHDIENNKGRQKNLITPQLELSRILWFYISIPLSISIYISIFIYVFF